MAYARPQVDDALQSEIHTLNFCVSFVLENQNLDIFSIFSMEELLHTAQSCVDVIDKLIEKHNQRLTVSTHKTRFIANTIYLHHRLFNRLCVDIANRTQAQRIRQTYWQWKTAVNVMRQIVINARTLSDNITRSIFNFHISKIDVVLNSPPIFYKLVQKSLHTALAEIFPGTTIANDLYHSFQDNGYCFYIKFILCEVDKNSPFYKCRKHFVLLSKHLQNAAALQDNFCSSLNHTPRANTLKHDPIQACLKLINMYQRIRKGVDDTKITFFNAVMHHKMPQLLPVKFRHPSLPQWNFKINLCLTPLLSHDETTTLLARTKPIFLATYVQSLVHLCRRHGVPWELADKVLSFVIIAAPPPLSISFNSVHSAITNVAG